MKAKDYAKALFEALREVRPQDQDKVLDNLAKILAQRGDTRLIDEIEKEYHRLDAESRGIQQVQVTTASAVNAKALLDDLNKIVGANIEIQHKIDEQIVGGVVVRAGDTLIDASVKNTLKQLKDQIIK